MSVICQATTIRVGPQTPVWNLQSKIIILERCSDRSIILCESWFIQFLSKWSWYFYYFCHIL